MNKPDKTVIISDLEYRIERTWKAALVENMHKRAERPLGDSRSVMYEYDFLGETTNSGIDDTWKYVLELCKAKGIRPERIVPEASEALSFFSRNLMIYANKHSVSASAFGESRWVDEFSQKAANDVRRHLEVTTRDAAAGLADGRAVYPKEEWPPTWLEWTGLKVAATAVFIVGTLFGLAIEAAARWFLS